MEVKIFTKIGKSKRGFLPGSDTSSDDGLEAEINLWLASKPDIEVKKMTQSQSGGSWFPSILVIRSILVISVWY